QVAKIRLARVDAAGRDCSAEVARREGAVDCDAIATAPSRWKARLDRRERQDAAAVRGAVRTPVELVGDGEASGRGGGAGAADADARAADDRSASSDQEGPAGEV